MSFFTILLTVIRSVPPLAAAAARLAKIFWTVLVVAILALNTLFDGNYSEALALVAGALGLGQVIHQTNKTTVAAELAQLAAGAAKAQIEALKRVFEAVGETIKPPNLFADAAVAEPPKTYPPTVVFSGPPRGKDYHGDGQAATSSSRRV